MVKGKSKTSEDLKAKPKKKKKKSDISKPKWRYVQVHSGFREQ